MNNRRREVGEGVERDAIAEESDGEEKDLGRLERLETFVPAEPIGFGTSSSGGVERHTANYMSLLLGGEEARVLRRSREKPEETYGEEECEKTLELSRVKVRGWTRAADRERISNSPRWRVARQRMQTYNEDPAPSLLSSYTVHLDDSGSEKATERSLRGSAEASVSLRALRKAKWLCASSGAITAC